jgi:pimeloyl-ACP methyl ester carboxylesterase
LSAGEPNTDPHTRSKGYNAPSLDGYTAILYFHGMGTPRRHEEISRLIDAFDQFSEKQDLASVGRLRDQNVAFEPSRIGQSEDVAFISLTRVVWRFGNHSRREGNYRIYEGFWSPSTAGGYSSLRVLAWLLSRVVSPFQVLKRPWRAHQRLKLATLYRIFCSGQITADTEHFVQLEAHYRNFENWSARRRYQGGTFENFLDYLSDKLKQIPRLAESLQAIARLWHTRFVIEQLLLIGLCLTASIAAIDTAIAVIYLLKNWLRVGSILLVRGISVDALPNAASLSLNPFLLAFLTIVMAYLLMKAKRQLSNFWSDVMFWTVQKEKDERFTKRREILKAGGDILAHVLEDPLCKRVVVIGHSLGSAIAYECLMRLGRRFRARQNSANTPPGIARLNLISHLITVGSPIDWIYYFFDLHDSKYHRYNRISERLRGDTSDPPFEKKEIDVSGKKEIEGTQWINVWDDADPISAELYSPRQRIPNQSSITDVKVASSHRPNFIGAHNEYLFSAEAIRVIFWISMFGRMPPKRPANQLSSGFLTNSGRRLAWVLAASLPWLIFGYAIGMYFELTGIVDIFLLVTSASILGIGIFQLIGFVLDRRHPLKIDDIFHPIS